MTEICDDILLEVFLNCDVKCLLQCSVVCKRWYHLCQSQNLWQNLVLKQWQSQHWLYRKAGKYQLNWIKTYQELVNYSRYSPDEMKYFVTCNAIEDELVSPALREAMFAQMEKVSKKWLQVYGIQIKGCPHSVLYTTNIIDHVTLKSPLAAEQLS